MFEELTAATTPWSYPSHHHSLRYLSPPFHGTTHIMRVDPFPQEIRDTLSHRTGAPRLTKHVNIVFDAGITVQAELPLSLIVTIPTDKTPLLWVAC